MGGNWRYYVDESALGLGRALAAARKDVIHAGHPAVPELPLGMLDVEWLPIVGSRGWIVIARDRRIHTRPGEIDALRAHKVRKFWIGGPRDESTWEWLRRLAKHWDQMQELERTLGDGPWIVSVNRTNLSIKLHPDDVD